MSGYIGNGSSIGNAKRCFGSGSRRFLTFTDVRNSVTFSEGARNFAPVVSLLVFSRCGRRDKNRGERLRGARCGSGCQPFLPVIIVRALVVTFIRGNQSLV